MNKKLFELKHEEIRKKLRTVELPENLNIETCFTIGKTLGKSGNTVRNYLHGNVADGYLAEAIYDECKRLKYVRNGKK